MTLVDPVQVEWMYFNQTGSVPITYGWRKKGGSEITFPVNEWKLVDGRLRITTSENTIYDEWTLISRDRSTIVARRRNGQVVRYKCKIPEKWTTISCRTAPRVL
ncbi:MAG: hypothetical protein QOE70_1874 [Chthoniobacter sp.]|nr:hypothetical protein [Chthoniobacter sp.]